MDYLKLDAELDLATLIESTNIAEDLKEEDLRKIGDTVISEYEKDLDSRSDWEMRMEEAMKLALQVREEKTFPWEGAANVKYPLVTTAAIQFAARAYPAIVPGPNLVQGKVVGYDETGAKLDKAQRVGKHMSYQIMEEMDGWEDDQDRMLLTLAIMGTAFKKTYRDIERNINISELIYPWDLVFDYWAKSVDKCNRVSQKLMLDHNDVVTRIRTGLWLDIDFDHEDTPDARTLSEDVDGTEPVNDEAAPNLFIEQHRYLDLDNDGYQEPYIVTVHFKTREVTRIVANYEESDVRFNNDGEITHIGKSDYYTQYTFWQDPNGGNMGLGFGYLLGPINEAINTVLNQLLDAGTLSNLQSGWLGSNVRLRAGDERFRPGEWKIVRTRGEDIQRNIVPMPVRDPSQVLFQMLGLLIEAGEKLSSVTDNMVGDNPPANQPATTTLALIEQGLKVFTSIYKRIYRSMTKEFKKLYALNAKFTSSEEYFQLLDVPAGQMQLIKASDYNIAETDIKPTADPNLATDQQKMAKVQVLQSLIPLGANPQVVLKRTLEVLEIPNLEEVMQPMPPPPPPPEVQIKQAELQADIQKMQAQMQVDAQKMQADIQIKTAELEMDSQKHQMEMQKLQLEIQKIQAEIQKIKSQPTTKGN